MIFRPTFIRPFVPTERTTLVSARCRRLEQLRKAWNVYRICNEVLAAGLMSPPLFAAGSDCRIAREVHKECLEVAIKLKRVTVSAQPGSAREGQTYMTPIKEAFGVDSANANLGNFLIYLEACGMEWKTPLGIVILGGPPLIPIFKSKNAGQKVYRINDIDATNTMPNRADILQRRLIRRTIANPRQEIIPLCLEIMIILSRHPIRILLNQALDSPTSFHLDH